MKNNTKLRSFGCVVFSILFISVTFTAKSLAQNTFDGNSVIITTPTTAPSADKALSACSVSFGGDPTVKRLPGSSGSINIYDCNNTLLGTISSSTGFTVPRNTTNGYWCFKTSDTAVSVTYSGGTTNYTRLWLANDKNSGFHNVKDFGAKGDGVTDDTDAIKNAVAYIGGKLGGTLYFPEGVFPISSPISLPGGIVIKGTSGMSSTVLNNYYSRLGTRSNSTILLKGANKSLFQIGECIENIKMENINLKAESNQNTVAVEAVGRYMIGTDSQYFSFENVAFTEFDKGIYVHNIKRLASDSQEYGWHFDYVDVNHCSFIYNRTAGIHVSTYNTDWKISNTFFQLAGSASTGTGSGSDGIQIDQGGAFQIENTFGGGLDYTTNYLGGKFIKVLAVGAMSIINSASERSAESINFATGYGNRGTTLTLINNVFGDPIYLNGRVTFSSTGNFYGGKTVNTVEGVRIFSMGDRFCYDIELSVDTYAPCGRDSNNVPIPLDQAGFQGAGTIVFQTGQPTEKKPDGSLEIASIPVKIKGDLELKGNEREVNSSAIANSRPILSVTSETDGITPLKPLIRLGHNPYVYNIERDTRGWLKFSGTQLLPYRGFQFFDAPVQLPSFMLSEITTNMGTAQPGTVVYCSNCQNNSTPCTTGGNGTLAMLNGVGQWDCK